MAVHGSLFQKWRRASSPRRSSSRIRQTTSKLISCAA
jgi:hypothetical protein